MRYFVRRSLGSVRRTTRKQYNISVNSNEVFNIISTEININGNVCEIFDKCFALLKNHREILEDEYDSQFEDYKDINQEYRVKNLND